MIAVTAGMEDLQTDLRPGFVDQIGDDPVLANLRCAGQTTGKGEHPAGPVWSHPAGNDKADFSLRPFAEIAGQLPVTVFFLLEPGVHGAHQDAILQGGEPEIKRLKNMGVVGVFVVHIIDCLW